MICQMCFETEAQENKNICIDCDEKEEELKCLCEQNYTDDICIVKNHETNEYELQFWGWNNSSYDCDYIMENLIEIEYCPICGRKLG